VTHSPFLKLTFLAAALAAMPGVASAGTLAYSGVLTSGGIAADGPANIGVRLYEGATFLCEAPVGSVPVSNGRFRVEIPAACVAQIQTRTNIFARVVVNGTELPPAAVGSVPFALRAERADVATTAESSTLAANATNAAHAALASGAEGALEARLADGLVPPGTVVAFAGDTAPLGWLLCDGAGVKSADYPRLFLAIGVAHGNGSTSCSIGGCNFNLPDYRGRFIRGAAGTSGRDPDANGRTAMSAGGATGNSVGTLQPDAVGLHQHQVDLSWNAAAGPGRMPITGATIYQNVEGPFYTRDAGGAETRPINAYVNYIIKY
jgi:microcystin-dependent protein